MNCNIYWQPAPISIIPNPQTCFYIDQSAIINSNQVSNESELKQLKKKVKELELENSQLKEEILILEVPIRLISENQAAKRQKDSKEEEGRRVGQEIQMFPFQLQKVVCFRTRPQSSH